MFLTEFQGFSLLDRSLHWSAGLLELEDNMREIGKYSLGVVSWLRKYLPEPFWPPPRKLSYRPGGGGKGGGSLVPGPAVPAPLAVPLHDGSAGTPVEGDEGEDLVANEEWLELQALLADLATAAECPSGGHGGGSGVGVGVGVEMPGPMPAASSSGFDLPVPIAVVPAPKKASKGFGGSRYPHYYIKNAVGKVIGYILDNENASSFDAHCLCHSDDCAISKTYKPWDGPLEGATSMRLAKGRCLAFLVAWLRWGAARYPDSELREQHMGARFSRGEHSALADGTGLERVESRTYVEAEPDLAPLRLKERQPRDGEPIEPPGKF